MMSSSEDQCDVLAVIFVHFMVFLCDYVWHTMNSSLLFWMPF